MSRTFIRQATQINRSDTYDDTIAVGSTMESFGTSIEDDLNAIRAQLKRHTWADSAGKWYDDTQTYNAKKRGIAGLNNDLNALEENKTLRRVTLLTDITVPALQNWKVLTVASSEAPTPVAAVLSSQDGTVVAQSSSSAAAFAANELTRVTGINTISPKNLIVVRDAATGQKLQSSGRDIFGLLQYESTGTNAGTFNDTSGGNRVKISFVRQNAGLDDLEACPIADIAGKAINYAYNQRARLKDLTEDAFVSDGAFVDQVAAVDVTLQQAYNQQNTTAVAVNYNTTRNLQTGIFWTINDATAANLFKVTEGSSGSTSTVLFGAAIAVMNMNAAVNNFAQGLKANLSGQEIDIGVTAGTIESKSTNDLRLYGAGNMYLDDGNQTASTWAQTSGIKLSASTAEWNAFKTNYGEVSLLSAITTAKNAASRGTKTYARVTTTVAANTDVGGTSGGANLDAQLPDLSVGSFLTSYDVFLNGTLLRPGANSGAGNDYYPGTTLSTGQIKFGFVLRTNDVITVVGYN